MKKILGLDLGVGSIGWGLINVNENYDPISIEALGERIILTNEDIKNFSSGTGETKNMKRTINRTVRKGYDRYQMRRQNLTDNLRLLGMLPDEKLIKLPILDLWQLRANAATDGIQISLPELGRVLYHINQKRGYKHAKSDISTEDKNIKDYVATINARYSKIQELGLTVGQYFAKELKNNERIGTNGEHYFTYRIKEQVFPREAYESEFDQIMQNQKQFYPEILSDEVILKLRNEIIFYQRKLKSCKHLVSTCDLETHEYSDKNGKVISSGPKVAPKSSPIFQICKIWESVNNITFTNRRNEKLFISQEQRQALFDFLDSHDKMGLSDTYTILGISKKDGWWGGKSIGKGLQGNTTKMALVKALSNCNRKDVLLQFNLHNIETKYYDEDTGEVRKIIDSQFENEPLFKLWHTIYSINDKNELGQALKKNFGIEDAETIEKLYSLDFRGPGFGNKSTRAIRKLLPYLQQGYKYSEACDFAGYKRTTTKNLSDKIPLLKKNELRQPIVEKILNQMINVVNSIIKEYRIHESGGFDSIRVELARELKQSKDERNQTDYNIRKREKDNKSYSERIEEYGLRASKSRIQKYRLWKESEEKCFYCGQPVNINELLSADVEREHIIPKSLLFDDSFSNKVCSCRKCNAEKGQSTAYDYMASKGEILFNEYLDRVDSFFKDNKISKTKRDRLLTTKDDIPTDFINRDLRLTQYISKKSVEILKQVCQNVNVTSGSVTDFIRHTWGYDEILHRLNFERYKLSGLTETIEIKHKGESHKEERIKGWTKRLDHRHHAIDALVVAMTQQSIIQRLNNLNTQRDVMFAEIEKQSKDWKDNFSLLEEWLREKPHFSVSEVSKEVNKILVSFKSGKKVATWGKRIKYVKGEKIVLQEKILVPRGALCEDSVYGKIQTIDFKKPIKYIFEHPDLIVKKYIQESVNNRIKEHNGDIAAAISSLKENPILVSKSRNQELKYASCYKSEFVKKYPITSIKVKDVNYIIDKHIREIIRERLSQNNNKEKEAYSTPIYADKNQIIPIHSIRCFTGLSAVVPIKYDSSGNEIGYVEPGNNHHVAIYIDKNGKHHEHVVNFWHAVERKKYGIPSVIINPQEIWNKINVEDLPKSFLKILPDPSWIYETSLQQNEMFILGMDEDSFQDAVRINDYVSLAKHLYRVQSISKNDYWFRYHIETVNDKSQEGRASKKYFRTKSLSSFFALNPHKVQISVLGKIKAVLS